MEDIDGVYILDEQRPNKLETAAAVMINLDAVMVDLFYPII
jgi:hypothetical protein